MIIATFSLMLVVVAVWVFAWRLRSDRSPAVTDRGGKGTGGEPPPPAVQVPDLVERLQRVETKLDEILEASRGVLSAVRELPQERGNGGKESSGGSSLEESEDDARLRTAGAQIDSPQAGARELARESDAGGHAGRPPTAAVASAYGSAAGVAAASALASAAAGAVLGLMPSGVGLRTRPTRSAREAPAAPDLVALWQQSRSGGLREGFARLGMEWRDWDNFILVRANALPSRTIQVFPLYNADTGSLVFKSLFEAPVRVYVFNLLAPAQLSERAWAVQDIWAQLSYLEPRKGKVERC